MDALDPSQFGLVPATPPASAQPRTTVDPSYPRAPVAVTDTGPEGTPSGTNLAPDQQAAFDAQVVADRAKRAAVELPGGKPAPNAIEVTTSSPTTSSKSLDPAQFGLVAAPTQPEQPTQSPSPARPQQSFPQQLLGSTAATLAALPRGLVGGKTDDYLNAAGMTPLNMLLGWQGPSAAFDQSLKEIEGQNQDLASKYPQASTAGELTGALAGGAAAAPALGWESAVGLLPKAGAAASYLGRNAGFGALMSMANGGDATTGGAIGSLFPALHMAGAGLAAPFSWATRQFAPLFSNAAREQSVGNVLNRAAGGLPIESSSVGPLDLAQATNNPEIAARTDLAPSFNAEANAATRGAQQQAVTSQIGKIGAPASQADASATGTQAIRDLSGMTRERERELWNSPALTDFMFQTNALKQGAQSSLNAIQQDDPGLMLGMTSDIRGALDGLGKLPDRANLQNINSFIGVLKSVARRPPMDNPRAGALATRLLNNVEQARDATITASGAPQTVQDAYQAARDFTRQRAGIFGTQDMRSVLSKNPTGAFNADPSEGLRRFFNFSNGSGEGAANLKQLIEFADQVKNDWLGRGGQAQLVGDARNALQSAARSYIAASLTKAARSAEGQNFNPKLLQDFLRTNAPWMKSSGLLAQPQIGAAEKLMGYAGMLRRPEQLLRQVNSSTQARQARSATFIDQIMNPWARRLIELGGVLGGHHGGGMIGAGAGIAGGAAFEHAVGHAESAMREMMAEALMNPRIAQDLMMKASAANRAMMAPETRQLLATLRVAIGSDFLPQFNAPAAASPAPTPAQ